jgi:RNA-dependent RNA polymerase
MSWYALFRVCILLFTGTYNPQGLLADRHIVIADQSKVRPCSPINYRDLTQQQDGVFDPRCMRLAQLCSQAVDYAKNGNAVDLHNNNLPKPLIKFKPDWHKAEVTGARELDYYVSDRALGYLYRSIELRDPKEPVEGLATESPDETTPLEDAITRAVARCVQRTLKLSHDDAVALKRSSVDDGHAEQLHTHYVREMRYICVTHTLVDAPDVRLTEEEVVLGTILANCTQPRWRSDRSYRMRLHAEELVDDIYTQVVQCEGGFRNATDEQLFAALPHAWTVWCWAQHHKDLEYVESFAILILRIVFDCLRRLGGLEETEKTEQVVQ